MLFNLLVGLVGSILGKQPISPYSISILTDEDMTLLNGLGRPDPRMMDADTGTERGWRKEGADLR